MLKETKFSPLTERFVNIESAPQNIEEAWQPDRRDGAIYQWGDELFLATQVALATGRPLLLRGEPGCGKSSFASYVARNLRYRYYEAVITSQTGVRDLLWTFDMVRRLADAQSIQKGESLRDIDYIEPGPIWWMLDRRSALRRGWPDGEPCPPMESREQFAEMNQKRRPDAAVLLIDEIDKADPDLPNALLVPLGSLQFEVTDIRSHAVGVGYAGSVMEKMSDQRLISRILVIVTTNEERELPPAFLRRCITHRVQFPKNAEGLLDIARAHFPGVCTGQVGTDDLAKSLAKILLTMRDQTAGAGHRPGVAEYLDALRACISLGVQPDDQHDHWKWLRNVTLEKDQQ